MRCLLCLTDNLPPDTAKCPKCGQPFATMLRDTLPMGSSLDHGQYHVEYPVGRGGFGITYRAFDTTRHIRVAIKEFFVRDFMHRDPQNPLGPVVIARDDRERLAKVRHRFQREGRTLLRIQHPNVVRILDLFEQNDTAYLVMEFLSGRTLRTAMTEEISGADGATRWLTRPLPFEEARRVMDGLVAALGAIHAAKVYHLDLKPANILIEPDGRVVLIDFGAARQQVSSGHTVPSYTATYAPPEAMTGQGIGPASDIFEAGMLLHEMLTGRLPPPAQARMSGSRADWQPEDIPEPWRTLIADALVLEPEGRPRDVEAWWKASGLAVGGASAVPEPPLVPLAAPPSGREKLPPAAPPPPADTSDLHAPNDKIAPSLVPAFAPPAGVAVLPVSSARPVPIPKVETAMSTTNNTNNTPPSPPPSPAGLEPDDEKTVSMRVPFPGQAPTAPPRPAAVPPAAAPSSPPPVSSAYDAEDDDRTVSMRVTPGTLPTPPPAPRDSGPSPRSNAPDGLSFGPREEKREMNTTTRVALAITLVLVIAILVVAFLRR